MIYQSGNSASFSVWYVWLFSSIVIIWEKNFPKINRKAKANIRQEKRKEKKSAKNKGINESHQKI